MYLSPEEIPATPLFADMELFEGYLSTMATIESNIEDAPEADVDFHRIAFEGVRLQAREHLQSNPDLIAFCRTAGSWAVDASTEKIEQGMRSSENLLNYVKVGLLDKLTIEELESRIETARLQLKVLPHTTLLETAFGDLLQEPTEVPPKATPPRRKRQPTVVPPAPVEEISQNDEILASLEGMGLSPALKVFVRSAAQKETKLTDVRSHSPEVAALSEADYVLFKRTLSRERKKVLEHLASRGIAAEWDVIGATRGRTYYLRVTSETEQPKQDQAETEHLESFDNQVFEVMTYMINSGKKHTAKHLYVSGRIAEWLDITRPQAAALVDRFIAQGRLVTTGIEKGSAILAVAEIPPETSIIGIDSATQVTQSRPRRKSPEVAKNVFTDEDVTLARQLCSTVAAAGNYDRGIGVQQLSAQLDQSERAIKSFVGRLVRVGICKVEKIWDDHGGTGPRKSTFLVKFPSQGAWTRFQADTADYLSILPTS